AAGDEIKVTPRCREKAANASDGEEESDGRPPAGRHQQRDAGCAHEDPGWGGWRDKDGEEARGVGSRLWVGHVHEIARQDDGSRRLELDSLGVNLAVLVTDAIFGHATSERGRSRRNA